MSIVFINPTYKKLLYARRAALSFFKYTPAELNPHCVLVDDCSPSQLWDLQDWDVWRQGIPEDRLTVHRFTTQAGLTRSWNWGLAFARNTGADYAICGNSDVLFSPYWYEGLLHAVDVVGCSLVGPVTNGPGITTNGRQGVWNYVSRYARTDDPDAIKATAEELRKTQPLYRVVDTNINGFFMLAATDEWWSGAYDKNRVFDPKYKLVGNEDELQRRWKRAGRRLAFVPRSFIFHYRAVSRGDRFKSRWWYRRTTWQNSERV